MFYTLNHGAKCVFLTLKFTLNFAPIKHVFLDLLLHHVLIPRTRPRGDYYIYNR